MAGKFFYRFSCALLKKKAIPALVLSQCQDLGAYIFLHSVHSSVAELCGSGPCLNRIRILTFENKDLDPI